MTILRDFDRPRDIFAHFSTGIVEKIAPEDRLVASARIDEPNHPARRDR